MRMRVMGGTCLSINRRSLVGSRRVFYVHVLAVRPMEGVFLEQQLRALCLETELGKRKKEKGRVSLSVPLVKGDRVGTRLIVLQCAGHVVHTGTRLIGLQGAEHVVHFVHVGLEHVVCCTCRSRALQPLGQNVVDSSVQSCLSLSHVSLCSVQSCLSLSHVSLCRVQSCLVEFFRECCGWVCKYDEPLPVMCMRVPCWLVAKFE